MLEHATVLIAEDETFIALALQLAVEDVGGTVLGPAATVVEALTLLSETAADAAILNVNLADGEITPVIERLVATGAAIIVQTGAGFPSAFAERFPGLIVHMKPCAPERLVEQVIELLRPKSAALAIEK